MTKHLHLFRRQAEQAFDQLVLLFEAVARKVRLGIDDFKD
jgi:hypothetical protein